MSMKIIRKKTTMTMGGELGLGAWGLGMQKGIGH
jgi:hypothetical protein